MPPVLSVVDYDSWNKGYMPPSEHILIDALAYRGARVVLSSDYGEGKGAFWLVMRDHRVLGRKLFPISQAIHDALDAMTEDHRIDSAELGPWFDPSHPINL